MKYISSYTVSRFCVALMMLVAGLAYSEVQVKSSSPAAVSAVGADILARSLVSTGNNARMKAVIDRARKGDPLSIAYIGGSITEGYNASGNAESWASLSFETFRKFFCRSGADVRFLNAGMAGTPSTLGMIRYKRDVTDRLGRDPDIVFVEFAVNDGDDPTNGAAYESLVRDILSAKNRPAVVLLFNVFQSRWNLQERLIPIGMRYGLPMISIRDALVPELEAGRITDARFFSDLYHPTDWGHRLMADCIAFYFRTVDAEAPAPELALPAAAFDDPESGSRFAGIRMIDASAVHSGVAIAPGAFSLVDDALGTFKYASDRKTFPANWHKPAGSANEPFIMTLECRSLLLVYKKSSGGAPFGEAEVFVDGESVDTFDGLPRNGWNNPWTSVLIDSESSARHTVTVKMAEGSEDSAFTILAFGYVK